MNLNLSKFKAPLVLEASDVISYANPSVIKEDGFFNLFCTKIEETGQSIVLTQTTDFRLYSKPVVILASCGKWNYSQSSIISCFSRSFLFVVRENVLDNAKEVCAFETKDFKTFTEYQLPFSCTAIPTIVRDSKDCGKYWLLSLIDTVLTISYFTEDFILHEVSSQSIEAETICATCIEHVYHVIISYKGQFTSFCLLDLLHPIFHEGKVLDLDQMYFAFSQEGVFAPTLSYDKNNRFFFMFYQTSGKSSSIAIAVTRDMKNVITFARDVITYPQHGVIYDGDYYKPIPFHNYIKQEAIPTGEDVFDIRDFGAIPDTSFISTSAFLAAIDAVKAIGGGTILVTGGYYCTATISIPSNTTLFIDIDSAIYASKDLSRYNGMLIGCLNAENVNIRGGGKIIGNGEYFVYLPLKKPLLQPLPYTKLPPVFYDNMGYPVDTIRYAYRSRIRYADDRYGTELPAIPRPVNNFWIRGSKNILIENIIIEDSFEWTLNIDYSQDVTVRDVVINDNRHVANTDGIDIMSSQNVNIEHCFISCADDGLCIKAPLHQGHDGLEVDKAYTSMGPSKHISISDCTVMTVMNALKIGTGTFFDISDIKVENCLFMMPDIYPGSVSGISIESADGSNISDIIIRNIKMDKISCPIFICLNMRNCDGFLDAEDKKKRYYGGSISNVLIENIEADDVETPNIITGFEILENGKIIENKVRDITIKNYKATYLDNKEILSIREKIHENIYEYPECNSFGDVPAYGFFIRHGSSITLEDIAVTPRTMNTRACIVKEQVD